MTVQRLAAHGLVVGALALGVGGVTDAQTQQAQELYIHVESAFGSTDGPPNSVSTVGFVDVPPLPTVKPKEIDSTATVSANTYYLRFLNPLSLVDDPQQMPCTLGSSGWTLTVGAVQLQANGPITGDFTIQPYPVGSPSYIAVMSTTAFNSSPVSMLSPEGLPGYQLSSLTADSPQYYFVSGASGSNACQQSTMPLSYGSDVLWISLKAAPSPSPFAAQVTLMKNAVQDPVGGIGGHSLTITSTKNFNCPKNPGPTCDLPAKGTEIFVNILNPYRKPDPTLPPIPPSIENLLGRISNWKITAYPQQMEIKPAGNGVKISVPMPNQIYQVKNAPGVIRIADPQGGKAPVEARPRAITIEWSTGWWIFGTRHQVTVPCSGCQLSFGTLRQQ